MWSKASIDSRGQTGECTGEALFLYTCTRTVAWLSNQGKVLEWEQGMRDEAVLLYLLEQHYITSLDQELQHNMMLGSCANTRGQGEACE